MYADLIGNYKKYWIKSRYGNKVTWANQIRILQEQIKKFAAVIGTGFIAAFKPFVQTLNKVMAKVIDFTQNVLNALGQIFGWEFEIGGGGITDDLGDVSTDLGDSAGSAGDLAGNLGQAAENAKKLKTTTLGIDELNINAPDDGSSGSGSGSGGSGSGGSGSGGSNSGITTTFKPNEKLLEAYKSSIKNLEQLGEYIGDTLTNAMNKIDWKKVYSGAKNFGKGLADFLNGLISPELFGTTGKTIANSLNTAIYAALSFAETFEWEELGVSIATGINEFFENFDFEALAETLNKWVDGLVSAIASYFKTISWKKIFEKTGNFLDTLELDTVGVIIGALTLKSSVETVSGLFKKLITNFLKKYGITAGKATVGLSLAAATFVLADSKSKIARLIGAPITAALAGYTFTGDIKISLIIAGITFAVDAAVSAGNWLGKKFAEMILDANGKDGSQVWELEDMTLKQAVKYTFSPEFEQDKEDVWPLVKNWLSSLELDKAITPTFSGLYNNIKVIFVTLSNWLSQTFAPNVGKTFSTLFEKRHSGDYDDFVYCDEEMVNNLYPQAETFINSIQELIRDKEWESI